MLDPVATRVEKSVISALQGKRKLQFNYGDGHHSTRRIDLSGQFLDSRTALSMRQTK